MFAVIKSGAKQYKVAPNDIIIVESLKAEAGSTVELSDVLMIAEDGKAPSIGSPFLDKANVLAEVVEQSRADKIIVFKKKRRKGYRRRAGHRQNQTVLRITSINASAGKPATKAAAEKVASAKADAKPQVKAQSAAKKVAAKKPVAKKAVSKSRE